MREPFVVPGVGRSGARHAVVWSAVSRVWWCERCVPRVVSPGSLAGAVVVLLGLESLIPLVFGDLVLNITRVW